MNARYFFCALSLVALGSGLPRVARAQHPDASQCIVPGHVMVVGTDAAGLPDPIGTFTIKIIDIGGRPLSNATVVLDFVNTPDIQVAAVQPGANLGVSCLPGGPRLGGTTAADGTVRFTVIGRANRAQTDAGHPSLTVFCDGFTIRTVTVAALDQDGGGMGPADNALWQADYFSGLYLERSDLDGDGALGPGDLSVWLAGYFGGGSIASSATLCP